MRVFKRKKKFKKYLIRRLMKEPMRKIKITEDQISLEYDGKKLKNKIITEKHEKYVGSWSPKRDEVFVDNDLHEKNRDAIALHETIEKYVSRSYGLPEGSEAHKIATVKEREFFEKKGGNWRSHQIKVGYVWKRENK